VVELRVSLVIDDDTECHAEAEQAEDRFDVTRDSRPRQQGDRRSRQRRDEGEQLQPDLRQRTDSADRLLVVPLRALDLLVHHSLQTGAGIVAPNASELKTSW